MAGGRRRWQLDLIAGFYCLRRAVDHPIRWGEPGDNLYGVPKVVAELDGFKHHLVAVIEDRGLRTMVARDKRRGRYLHHVWVARDLELYLAIRTGGEFLGRILGLQLNKQ